MTSRKAPREWAQLAGLVILDPDGWREAGAPSFEAPIERSEFARRVRRCTVRVTDGFVGWDIIETWSFSLDRENVTVGHAEVPVKVYRTDGSPTLFAGLQVSWLDGSDPDTGAEFNLAAGAGVSSKYLTLSVDVPGHDRVYEYVDVTELLRQRVAAVLEEVRRDDPAG